MSLHVESEEVELEHHPGPREYVNIAVILALITAVEVAVFYIEALDFVLIPILIVLSVAKFMLVVGYFMHLKFDSKLFRRLFIAGLTLALAVFAIVLSIFIFATGVSPGGA